MPKMIEKKLTHWECESGLKKVSRQKLKTIVLYNDLLCYTMIYFFYTYLLTYCSSGSSGNEGVCENHT
jgi:hypothetical protein